MELRPYEARKLLISRGEKVVRLRKGVRLASRLPTTLQQLPTRLDDERANRKSK